ncbi:hypothetical protein [Rivularia sp. UHCC 0363]|nr:hypothetical protein [Rivularia sp. UHCC 0363]MEA5593722.1 hypothetical protein [Rivularia sp. UHCC 0363]
MNYLLLNHISYEGCPVVRASRSLVGFSPLLVGGNERPRWSHYECFTPQN